MYRPLVALGAIAANFITTTSAWAEEPEQDDEVNPWAIVLDVNPGGVGVSAGGAGGVAGVGGLAAFPVLTAGLEARVAPSLYLLADLSGGFNRSSSDSNSYPDDGWTSWGLGSDVGLRHVVSDTQPIEVSWYALGAVSYGESSQDDGQYRGFGWSAGARVGLILQHHFNSWFALRLRTQLLEAGYQRSVNESDGGESFSSRHGFASVGLSPAMALRFGF
jgi:hypothetical protein